MLRVKVLASVVPLIVAGVFAREQINPSHRPCIALADRTVQLAPAPWQAHLNVAFTDDASAATLRVQIVDAPELADFALADDAENPADQSCAVGATTRFVTLAASARDADAVIHLSREDGADYRIFVRSKAMSAREAAALVAGAFSPATRVAAAAL